MADTSKPPRHEGASADALDASVRLARVRQQMFARVESPRISQYHVLRSIGGGGMGLVFAAWDPSLDRVIAIKVLRDASAGAGVHLRREAIALARLRHPNVVSVFEVGEHEGQVYLAMEYVAGQTLRAWVNEWRKAKRDVRALIEVFVQAADGLVAAHAQGLVHRDVKPENVMIDGERRVRLMDFGLARDQVVLDPTDHDLDAGGSETERTRGFVGTPAYMAPELFRGVAPTAAADQFALCACLFEALYGRRARPERMEDAQAAATTPVEVPAERGVSRRLQALLRRGLAGDPERRWPSMEVLAKELRRVRRTTLERWLGPGSVMIAASGVLAGVVIAGREDVACTASLAGTWSDDDRAAVVAVFESLGGPTGADDAARVTGALDEYAATWTAMSDASCRATFVDRVQSERLFDQRMRCLDRRRNRLRAAIDELVASETTAAVHERTIVPFKLPPVDACGDLEAVASEQALPEDPEQRERVAVLRGQLDRADTAYDAGDFAVCREQTMEVVAGARTIDYPPLLAEALVSLGRVQNAWYTGIESEASLHEAILLASQVRDARTEAAAWTELIFSHVVQQQPERGKNQELAARAATERARDEVVRGWLLNNLGALYSDLEDPTQSQALLREAVTVKRAALGASHVDVGISLYNLGNSLVRFDRHDDGRAPLEEAHAIFVKTVGPSHAMTHYTEEVMAQVELAAGNLDAAIAAGETSRVYFEGVQPSGYWVAKVSLTLARAHWAKGDHDAARRMAMAAKACKIDDPWLRERIDAWLADPDAFERNPANPKYKYR